MLDLSLDLYWGKKNTISQGLCFCLLSNWSPAVCVIILRQVENIFYNELWQ